MTTLTRCLSPLRHRWVITALASAAAAVAVFGLTDVRHTSQPRTPHVLSLSTAVAYTSLGQLRRDASSVAVLRATRRHSVHTVGGVPSTVTWMKVRRRLHGAPLPSTVRLDQLGRAGVRGADIVVANKLYIAYLRPYRTHQGRVSREWTIVGGEQGLYVERAHSSAAASRGPTARAASAALPSVGDRAFTQDASALNPAPAQLPRTVSLAQVAAG